MTKAETRRMNDRERADVHLRHLVENLVREGRSEREIEAAVRRASRGVHFTGREARLPLAWLARGRRR